MRIIGSQCGGCCSAPCSSCCTTDAPSVFEVDLSLTDAECGVCDSFLSGTYSLSRIGSACTWRYAEGNDNSNLSYCDSGCTDPDACLYIVRRELVLSITSALGVCGIGLQVLIGWRYSPSEPGNPCNTVFGSAYRKIANSWSFYEPLGSVTDCRTISALSLTFSSSLCKCLHLGTDCDPSFMRWVCDSTASASISAA